MRLTRAREADGARSRASTDAARRETLALRESSSGRRRESARVVVNQTVRAGWLPRNALHRFE